MILMVTVFLLFNYTSVKAELSIGKTVPLPWQRAIICWKSNPVAMRLLP